MFILGYAEIVLEKRNDEITKVILFSKGGKKKIMTGFISFNEDNVFSNYIDFNKIHAKIWIKEEIKNIKYLKITNLKGFSSDAFVLTCSLLG